MLNNNSIYILLLTTQTTVNAISIKIKKIYLHKLIIEIHISP